MEGDFVVSSFADFRRLHVVERQIQDGTPRPDRALVIQLPRIARDDQRQLVETAMRRVFASARAAYTRSRMVDGELWFTLNEAADDNAVALMLAHAFAALRNGPAVAEVLRAHPDLILCRTARALRDDFPLKSLAEFFASMPLMAAEDSDLI